MKTIVISPTNHKAIAMLERLKTDKAIAKAKAEERLARKFANIKNETAKLLND